MLPNSESKLSLSGSSPTPSTQLHFLPLPSSTTATMSDPGDYLPFTTTANMSDPVDPIEPLINLAAVNSRMDSLHSFISSSLSQNILLPTHQMEIVSAEISSAIQQVFFNGASLLAFAQIPSTNPNFQIPNLSAPAMDLAPQDSMMMEESKENESEVKEEESEVIELDAVEILAEHVHFCEICGKGFKRDANLRMHMRAHGEQFKRPEALAKPISNSPAGGVGEMSRKTTTRFSCPFAGCNRNQQHNKFKPLKSVICARNHFKRSHCPKMYSCERCQKKNFSVLSDLKAHLKNCGEAKWRCSCGTTFSRKDKLFGHVALFEGHMPVAPAAAATAASGKSSQPEASIEFGLDDELLDCFDERSIQEMFGRSSSPDFVQQFYM